MPSKPRKCPHGIYEWDYGWEKISCTQCNAVRHMTPDKTKPSWEDEFDSIFVKPMEQWDEVKTKDFIIAIKVFISEAIAEAVAEEHKRILAAFTKESEKRRKEREANGLYQYPDDIELLTLPQARDIIIPKD